ncbi:MAG: DUF167 domain-containing protein [Rhizobiaceae bacterium]|nr:DUF167 domain-containing protein [Rhizobiaceae bacterium]
MSVARSGSSGESRLAVRLTPNGGRDAIDGLERGPNGAPLLLRARVSAPPEDGKANKALIALLSKAFRVPKTSIAIVSGETSRMKNLRIAADPEVFAEKLASLKIIS